MEVTKRLIKWCDKKYTEAIDDNNGRKAFVSGAVEGFMDAAIVLYIPMTILCAIWRHEANKK